jgi:hypothetical protein
MQLMNVDEMYEAAPTKNWIKRIPLDTTFDGYDRKDCFVKVADIVLDNDLSVSGEKKRNTFIKFVPTQKDFKKQTEWLYLLLINGCIVKLGGTRNGLQKRCGSYLCGHHVKENGKSGDCSKTNAYVYNTLAFYLQLGCTVEMMGYELPKTEITIEIFGKKTIIVAQTYHAYESTFLDDYKKKYKKYPFLCDNCDPNYKS